MGNIDKCLIIGGGGFIGSHVARCLAERAVPVRIYDLNGVQAENNLAGVDGVELICNDVFNQSGVKAALQGVTQVVYLAYTTVPASSMEDLAFDLQSNVSPLIRLIESVRESGSVRRFVYLSSGGTVYGEQHIQCPISEDHPTCPISGYGLTKLVSEHYIRLCLSGSNVRGYVLRPSNAYGERQNMHRPQGAMGHFLKALATDAPIVLYGDGSVVRDYVYAGDVAEAIRVCLEDETASPREIKTFNVGSGVGVSLWELVKRIQVITGKTFEIDRRSDRSFDCRYNVLDCSAIRDALSWQPQRSLDEGISKTWAWIQNVRYTK